MIPQAWSFLRGGRPDAPDALDGQRVQERELLAGGDDEQAVRLRHAARDLRDDLGRRDADGQRQADLLAHGPTEPDRDLARRSRDALEPADVEERLLERHPLDDRGRVLEDAEQRLARRDVGLEPRRNDDQLRAEAPGAPPAHRAAHAVPPRLVARRHDHTASHRDRTAAQPWVVTLLDRREERIGVRVQDPCFR